MKHLAMIIAFLVLSITTFARMGDPIVIEVATKYTIVEDALNAAKDALLAKKFTTQEMQPKRFTATRTTGAKADYYTADVSAAQADGKVVLKITFIKSGTGLLNLKKVAAEVKEKLEQ
ncbi:MAG TPA: hypothetical protein VM802_11960 [Chitinophaga sp.]|uniref:hypothetical protein n=1 Tax=Chitinophaga sp. TaxID=1869181 RepID=UPI002CA50F72|nr:hypothetical protein [Chitinophaga sp.]HVI45583.1 hypothetical protein [Chitinophaga sp.]